MIHWPLNAYLCAIRSTMEVVDAAQEFHFDLDSLKFLKVFIYLSEVKSSSGAHQFVQSSHKKFPLSDFPVSNLQSIPEYFRINQDHISSIYGKDSIRTFEGCKGTIIIEDTSGFHRGNPLEPGEYRDILVLQYKDLEIANLADGALRQPAHS